MKKKAIWVLAILAILFLIMKGLAWRVESIFQDRINANPDRTYNITYADLSINTFFNGVTLNDVNIEPLNSGTRTKITGFVDYAYIKGLVWRDLFFGKRLHIDKIEFHQPYFEVIPSTDSTRTTSGKGLQEMFGDILSRVKLNSFRLQNGSIVLRDSVSQDVKGQIKKVNILATDIETDSLKFRHLIPFQLGDLNVDIDSVSFKPNDYTDIKLGHLHYNLMNKEILLNDISLGYSIDWVAVSQRLGYQNDIMELTVKEIGIHQLEPSRKFYTQFDIDAQRISIDELNMKLQRNKKIPRPQDVAKPVFQGIINSIPMSFLLDSIQISNSSLTYSELAVKKNEAGTVKFQDINGVISGVTNMPEQQKNLGKLDANIDASLFGKGAVNVALMVPYDDSKTFTLALNVGAMEMTNMNAFAKPLAGVEIVSGDMKKIQFYMNAGPIQSSNKMIFDYNNLRLNWINQKSNNQTNKKVLFSFIANGAIRTKNSPDQKNYLIAEYQSERNIYRAPLNYMIQGLLKGFTNIVPVKIVQNAINKDKKKDKKKKKN